MSRYLVPFLVIALILSIGANFYQKNQKPEKSSHAEKIHEDFPLLAKRISLEKFSDILLNFLPLRNTLIETVEPWKEDFAFYFEYLPTGTSIGNNSNIEFDAASLLKVPLVMGYYHQKERTGIDTDSTMLTLQEHNIDKRYGNLWQKGAGYQISTIDAISKSLLESDDTAISILADQIQLDDTKAVYEGLDVYIDTNKKRLTISARSYSSILKALYFSASLTKENSQKILEFLTETNFKDKLVAPLPENIKVAHKIGEYEMSSIFQDCGIIYLPQRPYLLCMISHSSENEATERMQKVSKAIYEYVRNANPPKISLRGN